MRSRWFAPICILAMLIFGFAVYNRLPEQVPSHWNINGQVNGSSSRIAAVLLLPAISFVVWLARNGLRRIDPLGASYSAFEGTFQLFVNAIVLFLGLLYAAILGSAIGWDISLPRIALIGAGILIALVGNELGRVQPNWFVGIRTPWTLADPKVWRRTHRLGGRVLFVAGLVSAGVAALLPTSVATYVFLTILLGSAAVLIGYSYLLWRQRAIL